MTDHPIVWPCTWGTRLSWLTTRVPNPVLSVARGRVYLLRGNGAWFSPGFGRLCARLRRAGFWAEDLRCVGDRWVLHHLQQTSASPGPIMLIGHSRGGRRALTLAGELHARGIPVALVVCIDVAMPGDVSQNIGEAVHLYRSTRRIYPVRPLTQPRGSSTIITNINLDAADAPFSGAWLHHLNITNSQALQDWVVQRIEQHAGRVTRR